MESTMKTQPTTTVYKRQSKYPSEETKRKISASMKSKNLHRSDITRQKISNGLRQYWGNPSNFPADGERHEGTGRGWIESGDIV